MQGSLDALALLRKRGAQQFNPELLVGQQAVQFNLLLGCPCYTTLIQWLMLRHPMRRNERGDEFAVAFHSDGPMRCARQHFAEVLLDVGCSYSVHAGNFRQFAEFRQIPRKPDFRAP